MLDIGGQFRTRWEAQDQFDIRGYAPGAGVQFVLTRISVDFNFHIGPNTRAFLELRDARAIGSKLGREDFRRSNPFEDVVDIRQGFVEATKIAGSPIGIKIGRQQISYGDQRVFGPGQWGNTGRYAWDAAMLKVETSRLDSEIWVGRFVRNLPEIWPNRPFAAPTAFVSYNRLKGLPLSLDLFYTLKHESQATIHTETGSAGLHSHSIGVQAQGTAVRVMDYAGTYVRQFGRFGPYDICASGLNASTGITFPLPWSPRLAGQFTRGSGDPYPASGTYGTFDGVFGGADIMFYGYLNLFFWPNLRDLQADIQARPFKSLTLRSEFHHFALDQARDAWYSTAGRVQRRDPTGSSGRYLGKELDVRAIWKANDHLELMGGFGYFRPGRFVGSTGPSANAHWHFLQAIVSF
ncbi:MAG: alginate export family protein [Acidobacteria bacterium]|nr:alginate export family protein [Acidobacteriota bacterium]